MEKLFKNSKRWLTAFSVVAFLMVAGWQVGADGTKEMFAETEVALENAVAGTGVASSGGITIPVQTEHHMNAALLTEMETLVLSQEHARGNAPSPCFLNKYIRNLFKNFLYIYFI